MNNFNNLLTPPPVLIGKQGNKNCSLSPEDNKPDVICEHENMFGVKLQIKQDTCCRKRERLNIACQKVIFIVFYILCHFLTNYNALAADSKYGVHEERESSGGIVVVYDDEEYNNVYGGCTEVSSIDIYGSISSTKNQVIINGGTIVNVYGGYIRTDSILYVNDILDDILDDVYGINVLYNNVSIYNGFISGNVYGGNVDLDYLYIHGLYKNNFSIFVKNNNVIINDGIISGDIYGGLVNISRLTGPIESRLSISSTNNDVTIHNGIISKSVYGGHVSIDILDVTLLNNDTEFAISSSNNSVTMYDGNISGDVYGGSVNINQFTGSYENLSFAVTNNAVTISGGTINGDVYGGQFKAESPIEYFSFDAFTGNTLEISANAIAQDKTAYNFETIRFGASGTYAFNVSLSNPGSESSYATILTTDFDAELSGNISDGDASLSIVKDGSGKLTLSGTNTYSGSTTVNAGTLRLANTSTTGNDTQILMADGTTLEIAYGGTSQHTMAAAGSGSLAGVNFVADPGEGNTLTLAASSNSTGFDEYTGMTTVLSGTLDIDSHTLAGSSGLTMYGGARFVSNTSYSLAGKRLVVDAGNNVSATFEGDLNAKGANIAFYGNTDMTSPLLRVTGSADIDASSYLAAITVNSSVSVGDSLTLLAADEGLTADGISGRTETLGTTLQVTFAEEITANELNLVVQSIKAASQSKTLLEGTLAAASIITQGADMVAGRGIDAARAATSNAQALAVAPFAAVQGGSLRYNSGSHIDMQSLNLMAGLAAGSSTPAGDLTVGAFFEYGNGSYNTYNSFNTGSFDGYGNTYFVGWGILGRMDFLDMGPGHVYVEASGRMGGLYNTYENDDMRDSSGRRAEYDRYNAYYGFHAGLGYVFDFAEDAHLDVHSKYFWTRVDGEELTLSTGETLDFEDVTSSRLRFGTRFAYDVSEKVSPYIGVAWEHEFDGSARGTTNGYDISSPTLKGDTGIGEIGVSLTPSENIPFSLDLAIQGYVGKREGVTGSVFFKYVF